MAEIFVLAEHRQGRLRDIAFEMLTKAKELTGEINPVYKRLFDGCLAW